MWNLLALAVAFLCGYGIRAAGESIRRGDGGES